MQNNEDLIMVGEDIIKPDQSNTMTYLTPCFQMSLEAKGDSIDITNKDMTNFTDAPVDPPPERTRPKLDDIRTTRQAINQSHLVISPHLRSRSGYEQSTTNGSSQLTKPLNISQKKAILYPDILKLLTKDEVLFEFNKCDFGDPFKGKGVDPENTNYKSPDFGFNNFIKFDDPQKMQETMYKGLSVNWKHVMDFAQIVPKCERVQNYISFINEQKYNETAKKYTANDSFPSLRAGILKYVGQKMDQHDRF